MATEDQNIKITFDTNAAKAAQETNKLAGSLDKVDAATDGVNKSMKNLDATFEEVYGDLQPLTTRMGEAEDRLYELALAGQTAGQEYQDLLRKVAEYRKTQIETDRVVDAAATTLGQKLGGAAQIAATGVQGITAGMALFGNQSEETEKALLKVQAAMAFADAISNISTLGGQFRVFKDTVVSAYTAIISRKQAETVATNEATAAQNRLNLSVLKNPYVLAAAAIAALVVGIYAWTKANGEAAKKEDAVRESINKNKIATDNLTESIEDSKKAASSSNDIEVLRARAYGKTDEEIQKLIKSQKELAVTTSFTQSKQAYDNLLKANSDYAKALKTNNEEIIESAKENQQAARELYKAANDSANEAINEQTKFTLQSQIDANEKAKANQEKANEEAQKRREDQRDKNKEAAEKEKKDREEDAAALLEFQKKVVDAEIQNTLDADAIKQENLKAQSDAIIKIEEDAANKSIEIEKAKAEQEESIQNSRRSLAESFVGFLKNIAGKNRALQKAAIIAESALGIGKSVIETNASNVAATAQGAALAIPTGGASVAAAAGLVATNYATLGLGVAANIAATAKALQAVGSGGGSASAGGASGGGSIRGSAAPSVAFNNSAENQIGQSVSRTQAEQPPLKVTVLESDITTAQNNVNVLVKKNEF